MSQLQVPNCPNCGAQVEGAGFRCEYCGGTLSAEKRTELVQKAVKTLFESAESDIDANSVVLILLMLALFVLPVGLGWWLWGAEYGLVWTVVAAGSLLLALLITVGWQSEREERQNFDKRVRPKLLTFMDEYDLSKKELLAMAQDELPEDSTVRKLIGRI